MTARGPLHVVPIDAPSGSHKASRDCPCGPRAHVDLTAGADPSAPVTYVHRVPPTAPRFIDLEDIDE